MIWKRENVNIAHYMITDDWSWACHWNCKHPLPLFCVNEECLPPVGPQIGPKTTRCFRSPGRTLAARSPETTRWLRSFPRNLPCGAGLARPGAKKLPKDCPELPRKPMCKEPCRQMWRCRTDDPFARGQGDDSSAEMQAHVCHAVQLMVLKSSTSFNLLTSTHFSACFVGWP